jgi:hypothetical protein
MVPGWLGTCYVVLAGLELKIFLFQPPKYWDYRHTMGKSKLHVCGCTLGDKAIRRKMQGRGHYKSQYGAYLWKEQELGLGLVMWKGLPEWVAKLLFSLYVDGVHFKIIHSTIHLFVCIFAMVLYFKIFFPFPKPKSHPQTN